jgi:tripartite-type tricarboxylate transporter receptor subunit TctC
MRLHDLHVLMAVVQEYIKAGNVRALAITTATRSEALPDVPAIGDFVPGYEVSTWFGFGAPKNTPTTIVNRLNDEINAGLVDPRMRARIDESGGGPFANSPAEFGKFIADETEKWATVVRFSGARLG